MIAHLSYRVRAQALMPQHWMGRGQVCASRQSALTCWCVRGRACFTCIRPTLHSCLTFRTGRKNGTGRLKPPLHSRCQRLLSEVPTPFPRGWTSGGQFPFSNELPVFIGRSGDARPVRYLLHCVAAQLPRSFGYWSRKSDSSLAVLLRPNAREDVERLYLCQFQGFNRISLA